MSESPEDKQATVAGHVALEIARQLADPVRTLRDRLGLVVDHLERHVATASGPTPYPWRSVQTLRQDLGALYLEATALAHRVDELDRALADPGIGWFDLPAAVDLGLRLASHHLGPGPEGAGLELMVDFGDAPPVRGNPGTTSLLVAHLATTCARSARARPGSTLSVRVGTGIDGPWAYVLIADNGAGSARTLALGDLARDIVAPWGGSAEAASAEGQGCTFELRLVTLP